MADCLQALNMLIKQLQGPPNFLLAGMKMWKRRHLIFRTSQYNAVDAGESNNGERTRWIKMRRLAFTSGGTTELLMGDMIQGATGSARAEVMHIEVTSGAWADGDAAGVLLINNQDGTFESENLNEITYSTTSGTITSITSNIATIAADSTVYSPVVEIKEAALRNSDGNDVPLEFMTMEELVAIPDKDSVGTPTRYYYENRADSTLFYFDKTPTDLTNNVYMVVLIPIDELDLHTDTLDFPPEHFRMLKWALFREIAPEYGVKLTQDQKEIYAEAMAIPMTFNRETTVMHFQPDLD
jgi:hypothetical protein